MQFSDKAENFNEFFRILRLRNFIDSDHQLKFAIHMGIKLANCKEINPFIQIKLVCAIGLSFKGRIYYKQNATYFTSMT